MDGYDEKIELIANPATKVKSNPFKLYQQLKENISILDKLKSDFEEIVEKIKPDLIISDFTIPIIGIVSHERGICWHTTLPSPCVYESGGVPAYLGGLYPPKNKAQRFKHIILNQLIRVFKRSCYWLFKKELKRLNLKGIYDSEGDEIIYSKEKVYALGMKELEFNQPHQKQFQYVGPILYTPEPEYQEKLIFDKNKKYVLITMGTHLKFMKKDLVNAINVLANDYPEIEFHVTLGEDRKNKIKDKVQENDNNNNARKRMFNVRVLDYISYENYLDNYSYVIHHGGTGIMYECIKRGILTMVFPQDYDQFDNAARLDYHKLAVKVKDFSHLILCFQRLVGDDKLLSNIKKYQQLSNKYLALETIYQEVKKVETLK